MVQEPNVEASSPAPGATDDAAPKKDTRQGRPERSKRGKGTEKRGNVAMSMADRASARFVKALHDDVPPAEFAIELGYTKQIADVAPEIDYAEFNEVNTAWVRDYYAIMHNSPDQLKSEIQDVLRRGFADALMGDSGGAEE